MKCPAASPSIVSFSLVFSLVFSFVLELIVEDCAPRASEPISTAAASGITPAAAMLSIAEVTKRMEAIALRRALRVANDLERIGDLAKNIGKRVGALEGDFYPSKLLRGVEHMASLVLGQLKQVLDAYAARDLQSALAVWKGDEQIDAMCTSLFRELLTYMMEDPRNITFCIHLMFCAKNIERMGDHATNIAETVHYMVEGRPIADPRPKGDTTAFASAVVS